MPLGQFLNGKIYRGVLTGLNDAFVIDAATRDRLIAEDPRSVEVIKPFFEGKHVKRYGQPSGKFLILFKKGWTIEIAGAKLPENDAWELVRQRFPAITDQLELYASKGKARSDQGDYWWELRACDYYDAFEVPHIVTPSFSMYPALTLDRNNSYSNNKTTIIGSDEKWLLAILNSKISGYVIRNISSIKRGGWFDFEPRYLTQIPIVEPDAEVKAQLDELVEGRLAGDESVEAEINRIVYGLYGLTEEEIGIVEGR